MSTQSKISESERKSQSEGLSKVLGDRLSSFLRPLLGDLFVGMDRRLVETFGGLVEVVIRHRHNSHGLVLTELGGELLGEDRAPAGTKRIGNLLRSEDWEVGQLESFISGEGEQMYASKLGKGEAVIAIWDESVIEKPESQKSEGLCAVRSSKAKRLSRIKPGYFNPPSKQPVHVPGFQWIGLLIAGLQAGVSVYKFKWWTTRGGEAENKGDILREWLALAKKHLSAAIHVFDRGFCGSPWLGNLLGFDLLFVLRWRQDYKLLDQTGTEQKAGQIGKKFRSKSHRLLWDAHKGAYFKAGMCYVHVKHPDYEQPLFLVICRPGNGRKPWYLLTNLSIKDDHEAWRVVLIYARRWQIELAYRFNKSELAIQSPRNKKWDYRLKIMAIATLAYVFLLWFAFADDLKQTRELLLRLWCHRTGKKYKKAKIPIYRLRSALAKLWSHHKYKVKISPEF